MVKKTFKKRVAVSVLVLVAGFALLSVIPSFTLADAAAVCVHNACNAQGQCVAATGTGSNQCQTDVDCATTHNQCVDSQCAAVRGVGVNQCQGSSDCVIPKHNVCQNNQCVAVDGAGDNTCQVASDCTPPPFIKDKIPPIKPIIPQDIVNGLKNLANTPAVKTGITTATAAGVVVTAAATTTALVDFNFSFAQMFLLPFGFTTRKKPWGVVYDSETKRPIDPAHVTLWSVGSTQDTADSVTDLDGRYGFLVKAGHYTLQAAKTHYIFPSQKLKGKVSDELYDNLYFGGQIDITKDDDAIINNIPMDPVGFDWNEFAKKDKHMFSFYSKSDFILRKISDSAFIGGLLVSGIALLASHTPYNTVVFGGYVAFLTARMIGLKPKPLGYITDKKTGMPLAFAIVRVVIPDLNIQVAHTVADKFGRYYCLVGKGKYIVKIETKNPDGSYALAYTSPLVDISKAGIIKQHFSV